MDQTIPQPTETPSTKKASLGKAALQLLLPIALLVGVILLFIRTNGAGLKVEPAAPIEALQFDRTVLTPDQIELQVTNTSPQEMTISQIIINDSFWMFKVTPNTTIPRLGEPPTPFPARPRASRDHR